MNTTLKRLILGALSLGLLGSCAHLGGEPDEVGREPAAVSAARACRRMSRDELRVFRQLVQSDRGLSDSLDFLGTISHVFREDRDLYQRDRMSMSSFMSTSHGLLFNQIELYAHIVAGDCKMVREGDDANIYVSKEHPAVYRRAKRLCGPADKDLAADDRVHPNLERKFGDQVEVPAPLPDDPSAVTVEPLQNIRQWVAVADLVINPTTGEFMAPDRLLDACMAFKSRKNVEDGIENLFLCLDAFVMNQVQYDYNTGRYVLDDKGVPKLRDNSQVPNLMGCLAGYAQDKIAVAADGTPTGPKAPPAPPAVASGGGGSHSSAGPSGASASSPASSTQAHTSPPPPPQAASGQSGASGQVLVRMGGKTHPDNPGTEPSRCLPADSGDGACQSDACVGAFARYATGHHLDVPATLSSRDMLDLYTNEKGKYIYQVSKQQARVLGQAYVVAAYQRHWNTPKEYNDNIREFAASCSDPTLRSELDTMTQLELVNEEVLDNSYDPVFADQRDTSDDKGRRMVESVQQILALRQLVQLLNYDMGADEVKTLKYPKWLGYLPVGRVVNNAATLGFYDIPYLADFEMPIPLLHYFVGADMAISFGNVANYQCNLFSTMMAADWTPRTSHLITEADRAIRRLFNDESFRNKAFCSRGAHCSYPELFQYYMKETDPASFRDAEQMIAHGTDPGLFNIHLRDWCSMRFYAAQSLMGLEQQITTMYPALAHSDMIHQGRGKDDIPGPPLFDRLKNMNGTDEAKAQYASAEADRVLPGMQADLKKYLSRVCSDLHTGQKESTYMAMLNRNFLGGFDYCAGLTQEEQTRLGLSCADRVGYLSCKMQAEADDWRARKELPKFLYDVAMAGMDALFIYSAASGGLASAFTPKGIITGGLVGLGFTAANYGVSYWIAQNNDAQWNDYQRGVAGAALEGVDSYANALTAIASSSPKPRLQDFVMGFVMGAAFSGKPEGEASGPRPPSRTPPEIFAEVAKKVSDFAESDAGGGVRFTPENLSQLKDWMMQRSAEDPAFADTLIKNMGDALMKLSDADYGRLFDATEGRFALAKVRRAMAVRLRQISTKLGERLSRLKSDLGLKKLTGGHLTEAEALIDQTGLQGADLAKVADHLGPREISQLADAADSAAEDVPGEPPASRLRRIADFLRKLCGIAVWCPGLQGLRGCPL